MLRLIGILDDALKKYRDVVNFCMDLAMISILIYFGLVLQPEIIYACDYEINASIFANLTSNATIIPYSP